MATETLRRLSLSHAQYRWFVVSLLWISHAIYFLNYNGLGVLGPFVKEELALNNTQFGLLFTTIFVGIMAIQIPAGIGCDRLGWAWDSLSSWRTSEWCWVHPSLASWWIYSTRSNGHGDFYVSV